MPTALRFWPVFVVALLLAPSTGSGQDAHTTYFPVASRDDRCGDVSPKKSLAWSHYVGHEADHHRLCLPDTFYFIQWGPIHRVTADYEEVPMVWSERDLQTWCTEFAGYDGYTLFANEPLLESQADMTATEVAQLAADVNACTPDAKLIGPNMHPTVNQHPYFLETFWSAYRAFGGDPAALSANAFHVYYGPGMPDRSAGEMIDRYLELLPEEIRGLPLWITEVGYRNEWNDPYNGARATFEAIDAHPRVQYWFGYAPRNDNGYEFIDWHDEMTPVGKAFRDVGSAYPGPEE